MGGADTEPVALTGFLSQAQLHCERPGDRVTLLADRLE